MPSHAQWVYISIYFSPQPPPPKNIARDSQPTKRGPAKTFLSFRRNFHQIHPTTTTTTRVLFLSLYIYICQFFPNVGYHRFMISWVSYLRIVTVEAKEKWKGNKGGGKEEKKKKEKKKRKKETAAHTLAHRSLISLWYHHMEMSRKKESK